MISATPLERCKHIIHYTSWQTRRVVDFLTTAQRVCCQRGPVGLSPAKVAPQWTLWFNQPIATHSATLWSILDLFGYCTVVATVVWLTAPGTVSVLDKVCTRQHDSPHYVLSWQHLSAHKTLMNSTATSITLCLAVFSSFDSSISSVV